MFQVEPASILAPLARRLRHTAGLLWRAAQWRGDIGIGAEAEKEEGGVGGVGSAGEKQWRHLGRRGREVAHSPL